MDDSGSAAKRFEELFCLPPAQAAAAAEVVGAQVRHLFDDALCIAARRGGEDIRAIEDESAVLTGTALDRMLADRTTLVSYKVLRALVSVGAARDSMFSDATEARDFADLGDSLPDGADERRVFELAFLRRLAARNAFVVNTGVMQVAFGPGRPRPMEWHATAGLHLQGLPEIACFMVNRDVARSVFAAVTDLHAGGGRVRPGRRVPGLLAQGEAALIQVMASKLPEVFQTATRLFGPGFRGLQVVFADASNRLPWERGCDAAMAFAQPMLGAVPRFAAH